MAKLAKSKRSFAILALALLLPGAGYFIYKSANSHKFSEQPVIAFDTTVRDLGKVDEGIEVKTQFTVFNRGQRPLDIEDVKSSCGCTFPVWKQRRLQPGQSAILPVTVDTAMKQDKVEKTMDVISNDPLRSFVTLTIKLDINDPHADLAGDTVAGASINMADGKHFKKPKIFTAEKCMVCHVDQGLGLSGKALFEADCAMCHRVGLHGKASVGPLIETLDFGVTESGHANPLDPLVRQTIAYGSKTSRSMPGFLSSVGGPLSAKQIDSLVDYLKHCKKQKESSK